MRRVQCAAVGVTRDRGLEDHLVETHIAAMRVGVAVGGAATRGRPRAVGARVVQVRIRVTVRTGMGVPGVTGVESGSTGRRGVVHGELWGMARRVAIDVSGVGRI